MSDRWHTRRLRVLGGRGRINATAAEATGAPADDAGWYERLLQAPKRAIKDAPHARVAAVPHDGRQWIVKCYRLSAGRAAIGRFLRATPAWREWRGARRLYHIGVEVALPLALVHRPDLPERWTQVLITQCVPGRPLSHYLRDNHGTPAERRVLFEAIGRQIGTITKAGWVNRDHKSANIMVTPDNHPVLIDCGNLRKRRSFRGRGQQKQIERLFALLRETTIRYGTLAPDDFTACIAAARSVDPTIPQINGG